MFVSVSPFLRNYFLCPGVTTHSSEIVRVYSTVRWQQVITRIALIDVEAERSRYAHEVWVGPKYSFVITSSRRLGSNCWFAISRWKLVTFISNTHMHTRCPSARLISLPTELIRKKQTISLTYASDYRTWRFNSMWTCNRWYQSNVRVQEMPHIADACAITVC